MSCILNGIDWIVGLFRYAPPVWDDLRVPATVSRVGSANPPTFSQWGATVGSDLVYAWTFSPTITEDLFFAAQFSHKYKEGTEWRPHVHWSPSTVAAGNVVWRLSYRWANVFDVFPAVTGQSAVVAAGGVVDEHLVGAFAPIVVPTARISAMLVGRIARFGGDGSDTYPDAAVLHEIDFHHQQDTPGSRFEYIK